MAMLQPVLLMSVLLFAPNDAAAAQDTITGTVRSVDLRAGTVEMLTGRGLVIRTYELRVDGNVSVRIAGRSGTLEDLRPGQVVRVRYTTSTDTMVATAIEVVWVAGP